MTLSAVIRHYLEQNTYGVIEHAAVADLGSGVERDRLHEWFSFIARQHEALSKDPAASMSERHLRKQLAEDWDELALCWYGENDLISVRRRLWKRRLWKLIDEETRLRKLFGSPLKGISAGVAGVARSADRLLSYA